MTIFEWNSDPSKEVERELGAEFLRAVKIFYSEEEKRKEFEDVRTKQGQIFGAEAPLRTVQSMEGRAGRYYDKASV